MKTFKLRLYPNKKQKDWFYINFSLCRKVWNDFLNMQNQRYFNNKKSKHLNYYDMNCILTQYKKENKIFKKADAIGLQSSLKILDLAFQAFFKKQRGNPHFKSWKQNQSYTTRNVKIKSKHRIQLPKVGQVKFYGRFPEGEIKTATIGYNKGLQEYWCTLACEVETKPKEKTNQMVGGDLGLKDLIILSNGEKEDMIRHDKDLQIELTKCQKIQARRYQHALKEIAWDKHNKVENVRTLFDFKNYQKARKQTAQIYRQIKGRREQYQHYISNKLVNNYDVVVLEKLSVKKMIKNHRLARAISNAGWYELVQKISYKCDWFGKQLVLIDPSYTSQICSECGYNNNRMGLSKDKWLGVREWTCPQCQTHHDRDVNAAINILNKGLQEVGH